MSPQDGVEESTARGFGRSGLIPLLVALLPLACGDGYPTGPSEGGVGHRVDPALGFPDSSLALAVAEAAGTTPPESLSVLVAQRRGIKEVVGIERLRRLRVLDLADNQISDVSPIALLDSLVFLDLTANSIEDISSLARLRSLQILLVGGNRITNLEALLGLSSLKSLSVLGNPLDTRQLGFLRILSAAGVQVDREVADWPVEPDPDEPGFGVFSFAFTAQSRVGRHANIWVGSTLDVTSIAPLVDENASFGEFDWSPAGDRIIFDSDREDPLRQFDRTYVMGLGGIAPEAITAFHANRVSNRWSPNGEWVAYVETRKDGRFGNLHLIRPDGSGDSLLTSSGRDGAPMWSPDGSLIAFQRIGDGAGIWLHDVAGGTEWQLVASPSVEYIDWAPSGDWLVYNAYFNLQSDVCVANVDGTTWRLTEDSGFDGHATWSPDGKQILFVSSRDMPGVDASGDLWLMAEDGSGKRKITPSDGRYWQPSWSPDGTSIACLSDRSGVLAVHVLDVTGQLVFNITGGVTVPMDMTLFRGGGVFVRWAPQ